MSECSQCVCGEDTFSYEDWLYEGERCCPPAGGERCSLKTNGDGVCTGIRIDESFQRCRYVHFYCDNTSVDTLNRYKLYYSTKQYCITKYYSNRTVDKYNICHGERLCENGKDIEECRKLSCDKSEGTFSDNAPRQTECEDFTEDSRVHRECYNTSKANDGEFDCLNRKDEKTVSEEISGRIDWRELTKCNSSYGTDGLTCGTECRWIHLNIFSKNCL